jgi:predicted ATPase/class 3 adenylate cyclase
MCHSDRVSAGGAPSGVVTFLFTDIEGSTRRWESDADAMRVALAAHDKVLRAAIDAYDGVVFSHSGDGLAAAFASPMNAINAAIDAQRELQLPVRMGIATGEAELRDGDYFGTVLNRAARVMAAGHGGQILVAESTAGLISGVHLVGLGPRRLRDLPNPITLFQLNAPGLRSDFPPMRALDSREGNLRPAQGKLIGREIDVEAVAGEVRSHRLVTLTGVGGVGKTRLALEAAHRLADEFPDGLWVFELAAVTESSSVPDAVAAVLGIAQQPGMSLTESVAMTLEGRIRLLVFDNCEHVVGAAADLIDAVLSRSTTVKVLATSREGLGIADERLLRVSSLTVDAAVELFTERARDVTNDDSSVVEEVCRRLDGIPLAIELAASRMESMTATEVRDRLGQRFKLLVRSRGSLDRHQTLRHAVTWSYDLLNDAEQALLERCSVFAGGFDAESACAVWESGADEFEVLDLLDALVRKSLLVADRSSGRTRFLMLETIRQFAEEKLVERGNAAAAGAAHAQYFASREVDVMALWNSPRQREAYEWFSTELANLRAAVRWASDEGDLDAAAAIAFFSGLLGFGVEKFEPVLWAETLIAPARAAQHARLPHLCLVASLCWMTGRADAALQHAELALPLLETDPDTLPYGIEGWLGGTYLAVGQPQRWADLCVRQLARRTDNPAYIRSCRVFALAFAGQFDAAVAAADGLIEAGAATDNPWLYTFAVGAVAFALSVTKSDRGMRECTKALVLARESGNTFNETILVIALARFEASDGVTDQAFEYLAIAIRRYHDSGNIASLNSPLGLLSSLLDRLGRFDPAATIAGYAYTPFSAAAAPELNTAIAHLRAVLGDDDYELRAAEGQAMSMAEIVAYAYEQIDQARRELEQSP